MPSNTAAYIMSPKATPMEIKSAPYTSPLPHQLVIRNAAVAINPVDWVIQAGAPMPLHYPYIGGSDVSGHVVDIGSGVTRFQVGDRVLGAALCLSGNSQAAFQEYTVLLEDMTSHIPADMDFEKACVLPLAVNTAASGLFQSAQLGLQLPAVPRKATGKWLLVWGGATSVGCCAIQLAVAAGYEVITTASPKNFEYVKKLGASQAFDYKSPTVVNDLITAFHGKFVAGAFAIGASAMDKSPAEACIKVLLASESNKFVACAMFPPEEVPEGVSVKFVESSSIKDDGVGKAVYANFLEEALARGVFVPAPEPVVVGSGLKSIQEAFGIQMKGVSAKKVVVSL